MVENTAMSLHNVNTEIDRYIIWPGQVCKFVMAPPAAAADTRSSRLILVYPGLLGQLWWLVMSLYSKWFKPKSLIELPL